MLHARVPNTKPSSQQGFTLLELLVAIVIFAIMSVMAYGGLNNVIHSSDISKQSLQRLQQLQHAISVISRDINQIRQRGIRDEYGVNQDFLVARISSDNQVEFTRGGRLNPARLKRSSLQRIAYRFEDNKLIRLQWPFLDRAPGTEPRQSVLLDHLDDFTIHFLDQKGNSHDQWPPLNSTITDINGLTQNTLKLLGIEINLVLDDWGKIRRLYAVQNQ